MVGVVAAVAIAVAAPYLAPLALGALGIAATATAIAVATAVITIGLSLAVSFAFRALGVGTPSAKDQVGPPQVFRQSISNSFIVYGKRRVGGLLVFFHAKQDAGGAHFRYFVVAVAGHQCSSLVDFMLGDEVVTVDGSGMVTSGKYANAAWLWFDRGTPADAANATFVSECDGKWTTAHQGKGVAKFYAKFKLTDDVVEAGMPNMTAIIEGRDEILDPRTATTGYSRNATLIFYDFNRMPREEGGFGAYDDEIPDDAWVSAQANVCDETVNGAARYAIDAVIQTGAAPSEIRDVLVVSQAGTYTYSGGKHLMRPGYWVPPTATLAEDDIAGPIQVSPFMPADAAASEVQGTYISPDSNYTAAPLTTWAQSPAPDDVRQVDIDLAFVTNKDQGDRILRIMGKRAQCEKTVTWPENIVGLKRRAMDTVQVDKADYGLNNYAWTITSWQFAADFGAVMNMREENADIYTDEAAVAPVTPPAVTQPEPIVKVDTAAILRATYPKGIRISAVDGGASATINIDGSENLIVNGDFSSATGWTTYSGVTISGGVANASSAIQVVTQQPPLVVGQSYTATFSYTMSSGAKMRITNSNAAGSDVVYTSPTLGSSGTITATFTATGTYFTLEATELSFTGTIDNVSVISGDGSSFVIDYATTPPQEVTVPAGSITGLAYDTTYYPYADVDAPGDATPTYGATTLYGDALNSSAHPNRIFLGQAVRTPTAGSPPSTGGGTGGGYTGGGFDPGGGAGGRQYP